MPRTKADAVSMVSLCERVDGAFQVATIDDSFDHDPRGIAVIKHPPATDAYPVPARMTGESFDVDVGVFVRQGAQPVDDRLPIVRGNSPEVTLASPRDGDQMSQGYAPASSSPSTSSRGRPRVPRAISRSADRMERTYSGALVRT
jgi:hypothetical protein